VWRWPRLRPSAARSAALGRWLLARRQATCSGITGKERRTIAELMTNSPRLGQTE
jgi:hypothetical protein